MKGEDFREQPTWQKGKKLSDLKFGDLIYICKNVRGFQIMFECTFAGIERGLVIGEIVKFKPVWFWQDEEQTKLRVRPTSCYLYGKDPENPADWNRLHWLRNGVFE